APDAAALRRRQVQTVEARRPLAGEQPSPQRAAHRLRLLADLFEHEVRVPAQGDGVEGPFDVVHPPILLLGSTVKYAIPGTRPHGDVAVVELAHPSRMGEHGARI